MSSFISERLHRFRKASGANVTMIFALGAPVLCFGIAVAVDFTNATIVRSKLNAAADSAALAALTPSMMQALPSTAAAAAAAMFNARANGLGTELKSYSLTPNPPVVTQSGARRTITVAYQAQANTIFSAWMGPSLTVAGTSTASAATPPNIDFYLLLDNSPSMSLPASSAGITQMQTLTSKEGNGGCAFACHQASTNNGDTAGNTCSDGSTPTLSGGLYCAATNKKGQPITQIDNYQMARNAGISLRLDELSAGVSQLMTTADNYQNHSASATPPAYRFAAYEMDSSWQVPGLNGAPSVNTPLMSLTGSYTAGWSNASSSFGVMEMFSNSYGCLTSACLAGVYSNDQATNYDVAMSDINAKMPAPGYGTNVAGDKPQEVMVFVTDGVEDESNINRLIQPINGNNGTNYCTTIKNRGIRIAILYTDYLPVPSNSFYVQNVQPFQPNIGTALQACASPGLYSEAALGANLGTALATLFSTVVQSAALSN